MELGRRGSMSSESRRAVLGGALGLRGPIRAGHRLKA